MDLADDFICNVTKSAAQLARHRQSDTLEIRDLKLVLGMLTFVCCGCCYSLFYVVESDGSDSNDKMTMLTIT